MPKVDSAPFWIVMFLASTSFTGLLCLPPPTSRALIPVLFALELVARLVYHTRRSRKLSYQHRPCRAMDPCQHYHLRFFVNHSGMLISLAISLAFEIPRVSAVFATLEKVAVAETGAALIRVWFVDIGRRLLAAQQINTIAHAFSLVSCAVLHYIELLFPASPLDGSRDDAIGNQRVLREPDPAEESSAATVGVQRIKHLDAPTDQHSNPLPVSGWELVKYVSALYLDEGWTIIPYLLGAPWRRLKRVFKFLIGVPPDEARELQIFLCGLLCLGISPELAAFLSLRFLAFAFLDPILLAYHLVAGRENVGVFMRRMILRHHPRLGRVFEAVAPRVWVDSVCPQKVSSELVE